MFRHLSHGQLLLDGDNRLTQIADLDGPIRTEPLSQYPVIKDLVVTMDFTTG